MTIKQIVENYQSSLTKIIDYFDMSHRVQFVELLDDVYWKIELNSPVYGQGRTALRVDYTAPGSDCGKYSWMYCEQVGEFITKADYTLAKIVAPCEEYWVLLNNEMKR